jgi:4-azaleucine resistance transporter AzlC
MSAELSRSMAAGARAVAPLVPAVAAFGLTFGVLAREAGFSTLAVISFSGTTFAGSAQFAAVAVLGDGGTLAAAITAAILLNTRYVPIGISVAPAMTGPAWRRLLQAQLVVDESWAVSHLGRGRYDVSRIIGAGLVLYPSWVLSSGAGAVAGDVLGDPVDLGLDAAFPALFLALLAGQVHDRNGVFAAVLGAVIALALLPFVPVGIPIVAAGLACLIGLRR